MIDDRKRDQVWQKGQIVEGWREDKVRQDACGAWMLYDDYGNRDSIFGWEVDHIVPKSTLTQLGATEDEIDHLDNLRPMNWKNNQSKGNDYPSYSSAVTAEGETNVTAADNSYTVNAETQDAVRKLYNKYGI